MLRIYYSICDIFKSVSRVKAFQPITGEINIMQNPDPSQQTPPPHQIPPSPYGGAPTPIVGADKKLPAALCGIFLGAFGVHKFILGYTTEGIIMAAVTVVGGALTLGLAAGIMGLIGLIEGILYLTKTDEQFVQEYVNNKKAWF